MNPRSRVSLERRERERADTRRKILEAARQMFVRKGYDATTMRAIAGKIGYTATAIYHYFENKEALVAELSALDFRALANALQRAGAVRDPVERFDRLGEAYVEFGLTHPMQYQFLFMTPRPDHDRVHGAENECYGFLQATCADMIATGRLRPEFADAEELAQMAWGSLHGLVALHIAKGRDAPIPWRDVRRTTAKTRAALIRGIVRTT